MKRVIGLLVLVVFQGCSSIPTQPLGGVIFTPREKSLNKICETELVSCQWDSTSQVITISRDGNMASGLIGSNLFIVNDKDVYLSEPLEIEFSRIIVPQDFKRKVLDPLKRDRVDEAYVYVPRIQTIIIDAGHGGKDPGATSQSGIKEKDVNLEIAKMVERLLKRKGMEVVMTRKTDKFISLQQRTEIASKEEGDLFVSIHANSNPVRGVNGVEVYVLKDLSRKEMLEQQRQTNHELLFAKKKMRKNNRDVESILEGLMYSYKQSDSYSFAEDLAKDLARSLRAKNRGVKQSRFFVVRNTVMPAVLIEVGYLSNPKEERLIKTSSYRKKIARAIVKSILEHSEKE